MKKLKQIVEQVKTLITENKPDELNDMLWQLICYPPKMPLRLHQEQLFSEAEKFIVTVNDPYFTNRQLNINGFKWGTGKHKVMLSHGWGSKAADFDGLIVARRANPE
jgi:hypothetical protein